MRGHMVWAIMALVAVLLMGAAKVSHRLEDIGMGSSMKERKLAVSANIISLTTDPPGLVYGPVERAKDGSLVYKVLKGNYNVVWVDAKYSDGVKKEIRILYPLNWAKSDTKTKGSSSGGSQPSKPATPPPTAPAKPWLAEGNLNSWELKGELIQDTRGWVGDNIPGTMTQSNSTLRGTFQVAKGIGVFGEAAYSMTADRSANWETTAYLGQNLAGFGGGLTFALAPRTTLSLGSRYYVDVPQGSGAVNSPNIFTEVKGFTELKKGDGTLLIWDAKVSTNALKDVGAKAKVTAKVHDNWGVSALGVVKRYPSTNVDAQLGGGAEWFPTATDSVSVGAYFMTPLTSDAPPAAGLTFGIKF